MGLGSKPTQIPQSLLEASLKQGATLRIAFQGNSMMPLIRPGHFVVVRGCNADQIRPGEVVLFKKGNGFILHRFYRRETGRLLTRGDARTRFDEPVPPEKILGKVIRLDARPLQAFLKAPSGFFFACAMLLVETLRQAYRFMPQRKWYPRVRWVKRVLFGEKPWLGLAVERVTSCAPALSDRAEQRSRRRLESRFSLAMPDAGIVDWGGPLTPLRELWNLSLPSLSYESDIAWQNELGDGWRSIRVLACVSGSSVIGVLFWDRTQGGDVSVEAIAVDPRMRRKGVGLRLIERLKDEAHAAGAKQLVLCERRLFFLGLPIQSFPGAFQFFLKAGFVQTSLGDVFILTADDYKDEALCDAAERALSSGRLKVRRAGPADACPLDQFLAEEGFPQWSAYRRDGEAFIAEWNGTIVACLHFKPLSRWNNDAVKFKKACYPSLLNAPAEKIEIASGYLVGKKWRSRGIGATILRAYFRERLAEGRVLTFEAWGLAAYYGHAGARGIEQVAGMSLSTSKR